MVETCDVVVRCKNEMPHVRRTLDALARTPGLHVLFVDSGSTDGSLEDATARGLDVVRIAPGSYIPGRVLNDGMKRTRSNIVAFVNADAVPHDERSVLRLVAACRDGAAAAYGRQTPRATARPITVTDHARAFPARAHGPKLARFFSMAASAVRRDVWERVPFDEDLTFSEDFDWTTRLRALGLLVQYVPEAAFEHSHDYDLVGLRRRMRGEGIADARILRRGRPRLFGDLARPFAGRVLRDACAGTLSLGAARLRWAGERARFEGLREGSVARADSAGDGSTLRITAGPPDAIVSGAVRCAQRRIERTFGRAALATVLLGSFACGEGLVRESQGAPAIRGDVDLVVVLAGDREARSARTICAKISAEASEESGACVDVWPVSTGNLEAQRGRLIWVDAAVRGARVVAGAASAVQSLARLGARSVDAEEIGRLLANRATGIALSRLASDAGAHDAVEAARHVAKGWLAAGDALLIVQDRYAATADARLATLRSLAAFGGPPELASNGYGWALRWRREPRDQGISASQLATHAASIWTVHAHLEAHRLASETVPTPAAYARAPAPIYAALDDVPTFSRLLGGVRAAAAGRLSWRRARKHPRETLARASVLLAYEEDRPSARAWAARALGATHDDPGALARALVALREVGA